jgi:hypothetical protein
MASSVGATVPSYKMKLEPLCRMSGARRGGGASVAGHIKPHRGSEMMFWFGALQSYAHHITRAASNKSKCEATPTTLA